MKVSGWAADEGACGFYRVAQPFAALAAAGEDVTVVTDAVRGSDLLEDGTSLIVAQRTADAEQTVLLDALKQEGIPYLYETDDALLNLDPANPVAKEYANPVTRFVIETAMLNSEAITVSTPELAEMVAPYGEPHVLPNGLPDYFLSLDLHSAEGRKSDGIVVIAWAGSSTHHGDFHKEVQYGLRKTLAWHDHTRFVCQGHDYRRQLRVEGIHVPWSKDIPSFHRTLPDYDIGLCPLAVTPFNKAKSGLKAMEYQAAGVVPVAQDMPGYRSIITDGVDGFLVRTGKEWLDAIQALATDHDLRARMREAGLARTAERTYSARVGEWQAVYEKFSA